MRAHWISTVRVAFTALKTNRVRSALTMLGIVIGVAAVIATVAVGTGASQRVQAQYCKHREQYGDAYYSREASPAPGFSLELEVQRR